jgi:hypothetical protein
VGPLTGTLVALIGGAAIADSPKPVHGVDHVGVGIADLGRGIAELSERIGVKATRGGTHPGVGTHNALLALGGKTYLEIVAPLPGQKLDAQMAGLAQLQKVTPIFWAVATTDLAASIQLVKRAGFTISAPMPGSRRLDDGSTLHWQTAMISGAGLDVAPFLIQWEAGALHPSKSSPAGCTLKGLDVLDPAPATITRLLRTLELSAVVSVHPAKEPGLKLSLACPKGGVVVGP